MSLFKRAPKPETPESPPGLLPTPEGAKWTLVVNDNHGYSYLHLRHRGQHFCKILDSFEDAYVLGVAEKMLGDVALAVLEAQEKAELSEMLARRFGAVLG